MRLISYLTPGYPAALFEALAELIGVDLGFEVGRSGPDPALDPFAAGTADLGWLCSTSFIELTTDRVPSVQQVGVAWVPDDPDANGQPVYFSDLLVQSGTNAASLDDLAGLRIGCNDPASLSGYHALRIELDRRGHDPESFAELVMTGGHHHSIDQLLAGEIDAAVIDSIVRTRRARRWPEVAELRIVERLGPWPTQPVVMRADASADDVARVRKHLLEANHHPEIMSLLEESALVGLAATPDNHCGSIRTAMHRLSLRLDH